MLTTLNNQVSPYYYFHHIYQSNLKLEHLLKVHHIKCIDIQYQEQVSYQCYLRNLDFLDMIQDFTNNQFQAEKIGSDYIPKDV